MVGLSKIDAQGEKTVSKSAYRQPITPQGLKAIEAGTLTWLDDEMYNNLNTGVLEQYLEEKNLEESDRKNLDDGFISVSPIKIDMHTSSELEAVEAWSKNLLIS